MKRLVCLFTALTMTACASVHGGAPTEESAAPLPKLRYSLKKVDDLSDEVHTFVAVTIENRTNDWIRVRSVDIESPEPARYPYNIIAGEDLETWAESAETKISMAQHNTDVAVFAAALTGLAALAIGAGTGNRGSLVAGAATVAGASIAHDTLALSRKASELENPKHVPEKHLMRPFAIPARGFAKRWVLIHTPHGYGQNKAHVRVETEKGDVFNVTLRLKELNDMGEVATR